MYCLCHEAAPLYFKTLLQPHLSLWIGWLSLETMSQIKGCSFFKKAFRTLTQEIFQLNTVFLEGPVPSEQW